MLVALLIALGVDLIAVITFAAVVLGRRRWLRRQPGEFTGAIRVTSGEIDGLSPKWKHGSGRWVRDVLVWSKAPLMFRNVLIPVDQLSGPHEALAGELKRLGDNPVIVELVCETAKIDLATNTEHRALVSGSWATRSTPEPPTPV